MMRPEEIARLAVLAQCLEPLMEKDYCATPTSSLGPGKTSLDFVISGVNTMPYFLELGRRIEKYQGQPPVFYDLVYESVVASEKNRYGKTINFGIVEALFPAVVARALSKDSWEALDKVGDVLRSTSKEDVVWEQKTRKFAWGKSSKPAKKDFPLVDAENVYDYYERIIPIIKERGLRNHHFYMELIGGMEMTRRLLSSIKPGAPVFQSLSDVHREIIEEKGLQKSPGIVADYVCVALFLHLSDNPERQIIWV